MTNFVSIAVVNDVGAAQIIRGYLEANGVEASLPDEAALGAQPFLGFAFGGYRVLVPGDQEDRARGLLAEVEKGAVALPGASDDPACHACGSQDIRPVKAKFVPLALLFGLGVPVWWNTERLRCVQCGAQFRKSEIKEPAP